MFIIYRLNKLIQILTAMKTPCAFHQGHFISQFCRCSSCLLPLCQECIPIHYQQHLTGISQTIDLMSIDSIVKQINFTINSQFKYIDSIIVQTINKYRESDEQHKKLFQQVLVHRQLMIKSLVSTYDSIFIELQNNAKRRQSWIRDFNESTIELKEQLNSMVNSLMGDKYLRTVIMWNRMKPHEAIQLITKKSQKKWVVPSYVPCPHQKALNFIKNNTNLKILEIEGDSGIKKILQIIRVLRYGQNQAQSKVSQSPLSEVRSQQLTGQQVKQNNSVASIISTNGSYLVANNQVLLPTQNPININSPNRKNSHKKLQVLSSLQHQQRLSYPIENR